MAALRVNRVDLARRRIEVAEAVTEPRGTLILGSPKTHERRSVPFPALLTQLLRARCAGKQPNDLVFTGADVKAVQRMLGHASTAMTLDVYTDPFDDDLRGSSCSPR